ncbi:uncharacterized protein LOC119658004 [Hermetia illucens]|uniref:uncharacterized protein LOC119658004 n=1 Tax=Hermetia illucens TaxID=343691 RepID=UPI0018CBFAFA|nr:uncharacterized protein LOC119658004 [Hermetia illucens]
MNFNTNYENIKVYGFNGKESKISRSINARISSLDNTYTKHLNFLCVDHIMNNVPAQNMPKLFLPIGDDRLADINYFISAPINLLLGVECFYEFLKGDRLNLTKGLLLQNTVFGWMVTGHTNTKSNDKVSLCLDIERSQECETIQDNKIEKDNQIELLFEKTSSRTNEGRFIVQHHFNENIKNLGSTYTTALRRFLGLEKKLQANNELNTHYSEFMMEYLNLKHMRLASNQNDFSGYFLPHHGVLRPSAESTKLRVVFDASCISSSGLSLNNCLSLGPKLQQDIFDILIRFRKYKYVLTADIRMMYRQILMNELDTCYQKILWRPNRNEKIQIFELLTLTYGTVDAPYLAVKCLQSLANLNKREYPLESQIILSDFYMDDLVTGANSLKQLEKIANNIRGILSQAKLELHKWYSNSYDIVKNISQMSVDDFNSKCNSKVLGVSWNVLHDYFEFPNYYFCNMNNITKRKVLSEISMIYDPMGLLGPISFKAKYLMQQIWKCELNWDDNIPVEILKTWTMLKSQFGLLENIKINRPFEMNESEVVDLIGFSDASTMGYGACVYIRIKREENYELKLVCSKSRIAPIKGLTLPRLELNGTVLLAKLMKRVVTTLKLNPDPKITLFSDSMIALSWIKTKVLRRDIYINNRVSEILNISNPEHWYYTNTKSNPADFVSRGMFPIDLVKNKMWWYGPDFLKDFSNSWILHNEKRFHNSIIVAESINKEHEKIVQVTNIQIYRGYLTVKELRLAEMKLIKYIQQQSFSKELIELEKGQEVSNRSSLLSLNPFYDQNKILRVGGRLKNSLLKENNKFPIILPTKNHFVNLIILEKHKELHHGSYQLLLSELRQKYWILNGANYIKNLISKCVECRKFKIKTYNQIMGNLPEDRVRPSRPFSVAGVDYAGPFNTKFGPSRSTTSCKSYIVLFICFSTKAIHLELVQSLSTDAFFAAFKRFIGRRGLPLKIYSDNGTNFIGARNELKAFLKKYTEEENVLNFMNVNEIEWNLIPPRNPHFGGLWEGNIRSVKMYLKKMTGSILLSYEEFNTIIIEIEACLNSRSITPISNDPDELMVLTPGHFLIGDSLRTINIPNVDENIKYSERWKLCQQQVRKFWRNWQKGYLNSLQQRIKWKKPKVNIELNNIVIIKEDHLPQQQWLLGRWQLQQQHQQNSQQQPTQQQFQQNLQQRQQQSQHQQSQRQPAHLDDVAAEKL